MKSRAGAAVTLLAAAGAVGAVLTAVPAQAATGQPTVTLTGRLVQVDNHDGPDLSALRTPDGRYVPVAHTAVAHVRSGSIVTLAVVVPQRARLAAGLKQLDSAAGAPAGQFSALGRATVAAAQAGTTLTVTRVVASADPVSTFMPATRQVYVAVVTPAGSAGATTATPDQVTAQVAGASHYWSTVTGGAVTMAVATISAPYVSAYDCTDPFGMWNEAVARVGFPVNTPNATLLLELPPGISQDPSAGCSYGLGTIGAGPNDNGAVYVADDAWPVLAHESGHNMSLQHADELSCPRASDAAAAAWATDGCMDVSYGDGQDVMSASARGYAPFLSAPQELRVGFLPTSAARVITTASTQDVALAPLAGRTGLRTAEVVDPGTGVSYYVEYRTAAAPDTGNVFGAATGVRVLRFNPDPQNATTLLLDPSPTGSPDGDATLHVGQTFTSYDGAVRVTTVSASPTGAVVTIAVGPPPAPSPHYALSLAVASRDNWLSGTATVHVRDAAGGTPTGTVGLYVNARLVATRPINGGVATLPTGALPLGTSTLVARASGFSSNAVRLTVRPSRSRIAVHTGAVHRRHAIALTAFVGSSGFVPGGLVAVYSGRHRVAVGTLRGGVVHLTLPALSTPGRWVFRVVYVGGGHAAPTSAWLRVSVPRR